MAASKSAKGSTEGKLRIRVLAYEPRMVDSAVRQIIETVDRFESQVIGPIPLPTKIKKFSVNRSPFIYKTSQEQFEMRTHTRLLDIESPSPQIIEALSNLSFSAGVSIEVQTVS